MRKENPSENKARTSKYADQNQIPKGSSNDHSSVKANSNFSRMKSSLGSHLAKGFSAAEKKTKSRVLQVTADTKKQPQNNSDTTAQQKNQPPVYNTRTKRSLIGDLSCAVSSRQVHPQTARSLSKTTTLGGASEDLFLEIDHLRNLLQESKDKEFKLQAELAENKINPKVTELKREIDSKKSEIDGLLKKVELLESEKDHLSGQLVSLASMMGEDGERLGRDFHGNLSDVEMEVVELRRLNKELQLQKRNLASKISSLEFQLSTIAKVSESDTVEKIRAEASLLKNTNEVLCKQVEGLQMSRMNEVEELAYLRWVNSCLRDELRNSTTGSSNNATYPPSPNPIDKTRRESICLSPFPVDEDSDNSETSATKRLYLVKKLKKWPITDEDFQKINLNDDHNNQNSSRRHSISGTNCTRLEDMNTILSKKCQGIDKVDEVLISQKYDLEISNRPSVYTNSLEVFRASSSSDVEKRALRVPNPPPRPSCSGLMETTQEINIHVVAPVPPPPPPPPPPPALASRNVTGKVQRAPQVVEFYQTLMKRDSRKDCLNSGTTDMLDVANVRSNMIGEIENRSSHLLAIKADIETQGEFVNFLIREVNNAVYSDIEDVVAFVKWLDDELGFLVDERAVLKHFDWPEKKSDTLREAAFAYRDLKKFENEVSNYEDDPCLPCDIALKKMASLSERMERTVYNILRTRDSLMRHCKEFNIPTDWMLDMGIISKIKFGSVKLAKMYMKRVAMELQYKGAVDKDSSLDYMLLQGVRFAFRIHQFAGGFDAETMQAFEELRDLASVLNKDRD